MPAHMDRVIRAHKARMLRRLFLASALSLAAAAAFGQSIPILAAAAAAFGQCAGLDGDFPLIASSALIPGPLSITASKVSRP